MDAFTAVFTQKGGATALHEQHVHGDALWIVYVFWTAVGLGTGAATNRRGQGATTLPTNGRVDKLATQVGGASR